MRSFNGCPKSDAASGLALGEVEAAILFAALARGKLLGAVEPVAHKRLAVEQSAHRMHSRPFSGALNKEFFNTVAEQVLQPIPLGLGLAADHDRGEAPRPDLVAPTDQACDLAGEVRVEVTHEVRELFRVADAEQAMVMIRQDDDGRDAHVVDPLGTAEDAEDDLVDSRAWA